MTDAEAEHLFELSTQVGETFARVASETIMGAGGDTEAVLWALTVAMARVLTGTMSHEGDVQMMAAFSEGVVGLLEINRRAHDLLVNSPVAGSA